MDGLINLYKPVGLTSAVALQRARRITGQRKSGHAGTLDPAAEGVLILCLGRATKLVESLMDLPKVYRATARLDQTSPGYDSERDVTPVAVERIPDEAAVRAALSRFVGEIQQVPPALSAVKVGGRPAYRLSREGKPPELAARPVRIYQTTLWSYNWPCVEFEVACGRGTYIRALIRDLGVALQTGGCLTRLVRTAVGPWTADAAWTLERLEQAPEAQWLIPPAQVPALLAAAGGNQPESARRAHRF